MVAQKMFQLMLVLGTVAVTSIVGQNLRNIGLTGREIRLLELGQNPELLEFAAMSGESVIVIIDGPDTLAVAQENVNVYINCLPWLQRFPGAQLRWSFEDFDHNFVSQGGVQEISPPGTLVRTIGGRYNEWFNITRTLVVQAAQTSSTGRYICDACYFLGDPVREECHRANVTLNVIGGPPLIDDGEDDEGPIEETDTQTVYRVGADFCIRPDTTESIVIRCRIPNTGGANTLNISQAFPDPDRAWSQDGDLLYREVITSVPNIQESVDFFMGPMNTMRRMFLAPGAVEPSIISIGGGAIDGEIRFDFQVLNSSSVASFEEPIFSMEIARIRQEALQAVIGTWTCEVNNTFGDESASSTVRLCGPPPMIRTCPGGSNDILFPQPGSSVPIGCIVCIPQGTIITLDCTAGNEADVEYEWRDSSGQLVSTMALFTTSTADSYNCTASNTDNSPASEVTVLAYSDAVSYTFQITEVSASQPRPDNGCSRLRDQSGLEGVDACVFVGETLDLNCFSGDEALEITGPSGDMSINGTLTVNNVMASDDGAYNCQLTSPGPCGGAEFSMVVRVFEPARIDRIGSLPPVCTHGAGRFSMEVNLPPNTPVTLCCPYSGIELPNNTRFFQVNVDQNGCAFEVPLSGGVDSGSNLALTLAFNGSGNTFVCRTSNRAGADADIISFRPMTEGGMWVEGELSLCNFRCRDGVRTRTVLCRSRVDGSILPDTSCDPLSDPRPSDTVSCAAEYPNECLLDPIWITGEWTQCTGECGGGWRFRRVMCQVIMTGDIRPNSDCNDQPRPESYDTSGCQRECCIEDAAPAYCRSQGSGYCGDEAFSKMCCWTCGRKTIGSRG